jgi:superfamily II DNA/RNA helicase
LNYDLPRVSADYIHRVGRTARAGRGGAALTFVSQYDIEVFKAIEETVGREMTQHELVEQDVLALLKNVNAAKRMAKIRLEDFQLTNKQVKRKRQQGADEDGEGGAGGAEDDGGDGGEELRDRLSADRMETETDEKPKPVAAAAASSGKAMQSKPKKPKQAASNATGAASSTSSKKKPRPAA